MGNESLKPSKIGGIKVIENYFPSDACFPVPMPLTSSGVHPSLGYLLLKPLLCFGNVVAGNNNDSKPGNLQLFCHRCRLFSNAHDKFYCYSFWVEKLFQTRLRANDKTA